MHQFTNSNREINYDCHYDVEINYDGPNYRSALVGFGIFLPTKAPGSKFGRQAQAEPRIRLVNR